MSESTSGGVRRAPADATEQVAALPRRVSHVSHATLAACDGGRGPATPSEIMIYDEEAYTLASVCSALRGAVRRGLVDRWGRGIYAPTLFAHDLRSALEDRFLVDTGDGDE